MPRLTVIAEQLLAPVPGGTGRYTRELLRAMAATAPSSWELTTVISSSGDAEAATVPGVDGPYVLKLARRALITAWEHRVPVWPGGDSVHAMTPLAPPSRRGHKLVVTVHDTVPWTNPETLTPRGVAWHRRTIARAARTADALIVPTEAVADELTRFVAIKAPVHVVGEGIAPSLTVEPKPDESHTVISRLRLPARYVLAIGTIEPRKGYEHLIRAASLTPGLPVVIVGRQGWGGMDLAAIRDECGLPRERIRILEAVDDAELSVLLRHATVLVAPSMAEGFGLPVLEAMALGVPVVHSDAPALVEVAGGAGVVAPRADPTALAEALHTVSNDPERRAELVAAGKQRATRFSWERAAHEVWRIHLTA